MKDEANYCRNIDSSTKPWCYVQGEKGPVKEYCSIPPCCKYTQKYMFILKRQVILFALHCNFVFTKQNYLKALIQNYK